MQTNAMNVSKKPGYFPSKKLFIIVLLCAAVSPVVRYYFYPAVFLLIPAMELLLQTFSTQNWYPVHNTVSPLPLNISNMQASSEKHPKRLVIFTQDIINIHSCSESTARRRLKEVKYDLNKEEHQDVTIKEYCTYFDLPYIETCQFLKIL